ncbi:MAG TPA: hypothetical protein VFP97_01350 [Chitinophagaceae bacterium]|nr:hypothetical protein [Chitinophagaceae bacterium]
MKFLTPIFFVLPLSLCSQDITGVWTGYIKTPGSELEYELAISGGDKRLNGYSLIIYPKDGIENIGIKTAKIRQGKKEVFFEDGELVYDNFTTQPRRVKLFGNLSLKTRDTLMILHGEFGTRSLDFRDPRTYFGEVYLQKTSRPLSSKMLITMDEINLKHNLSFVRPKQIKRVRQPTNTNPRTGKTVPASVITPPLKPNERKIETISEILFTGDSLLLSVFDNGTIDGDTISMALNGRIIVDKVKLTTRAFRTAIPSALKPGDSLILVMHAESLGLIPPNTGLLVIEDGTVRHEIRFEGDLQRSSAIILRKRKSQN